MLRIYDRQPGECLELLGDLDPETGVTIGGNDGIDRDGELITSIPGLNRSTSSLGRCRMPWACTAYPPASAKP